MTTRPFVIAKWFITAFFVISLSVLMLMMAHALYDTTRSRQSNERVSAQQSERSSRRIDLLNMQIDMLGTQLADARYKQGLAEASCPAVKE